MWPLQTCSMSGKWFGILFFKQHENKKNQYIKELQIENWCCSLNLRVVPHQETPWWWSSNISCHIYCWDKDCYEISKCVLNHLGFVVMSKMSILSITSVIAKQGVDFNATIHSCIYRWLNSRIWHVFSNTKIGVHCWWSGQAIIVVNHQLWVKFPKNAYRAYK